MLAVRIVESIRSDLLGSNQNLLSLILTWTIPDPWPLHSVCSYTSQGASLVAWTVKNLPTMQETRIRFLGRGHPLEKGMATHSSILAWRIPWTEEPGGLQSMGLQRVGRDWVTNTFTFQPELLLTWTHSFPMTPVLMALNTSAIIINIIIFSSMLK